MDSFIKAGGVLVGFCLILALVAALIAFPLKWCWNGVVPDLFPTRAITAGEAFCLAVVSGVLFGARSTSTKK